MSVTTIKAMKQFINSQLVEINRFNEFDENASIDDLVLILEEHDYEAPETTYYADAYEIVSGSQFIDYYPSEKFDFSECDNSLECVTLEANAILKSAYENLLRDVISDFIENL